MRECRRVLRPDGVLFLNIGDSYASGKGTCGNPGGGRNSYAGAQKKKDDSVYPLDRGNVSTLRQSNLKPLDLVLMPQRLALALQLDGWYVRSIIIWHKTNTMPESVNGWRWVQHRIKVEKEPDTRTEAEKQSGMRAHSGYEVTGSAEYIDCPGCEKCSPNNGLILVKGSWRPTENHEYILMLSKTDSYYCDREAVRTEQTGNDHSRGNGQGDKQYQEERESYKGFNSLVAELPQGKNLRSVWTFPSQASGFEHYAAFPEKLPELCIRAATSEHGVCAICGTPWARVVKPSAEYSEHLGGTIYIHDGAGDIEKGRMGKTERHSKVSADYETLGWKPSCNCKTELPPLPAIVLDPFNGTGRTIEMSIQRNMQGGLL
jgi:hypothetical protein